MGWDLRNDLKKKNRKWVLASCCVCAAMGWAPSWWFLQLKPLLDRDSVTEPSQTCRPPDLWPRFSLTSVGLTFPHRCLSRLLWQVWTPSVMSCKWKPGFRLRTKQNCFHFGRMRIESFDDKFSLIFQKILLPNISQPVLNLVIWDWITESFLYIYIYVCIILILQILFISWPAGIFPVFRHVWSARVKQPKSSPREGSTQWPLEH